MSKTWVQEVSDHTLDEADCLCVINSETSSISSKPTNSASSMDAISSDFPEANIESTDGSMAATFGFLFILNKKQKIR